MGSRLDALAPRLNCQHKARAIRVARSWALTHPPCEWPDGKGRRTRGKRRHHLGLFRRLFRLRGFLFARLYLSHAPAGQLVVGWVTTSEYLPLFLLLFPPCFFTSSRGLFPSKSSSVAGGSSRLDRADQIDKGPLLSSAEGS